MRTPHPDIARVTAPDASSLSGRTVSHFRVLEPLGAGGMGVVYRAEDVTLGRTVALKFMLPDYTADDNASARFLREARAVATLDHPNICTVHEAGKSEDGHLFLAMSHYAGETIKDRLTRTGALPVEQTLDIAVQIARGLACAHTAGIVHRDLKPANVMLTADGTVKILDFGVAKLRDQTMTASGLAMGTVAYMSPEQMLGERVDGRTDLWSLGVMLVEMLTGKHPAGADHSPGTLARRIEARHLAAIPPQVTPALTQLVERLTRRDPEERYQNATDVVADLNELRELMAGTRVGRPATGRMRTRVALAIGGAVLVVAAAAGVLRWTKNARSATPAGTQAFSLAVLPLRNYGSRDQDYFADGMTDELTSTLTKIEGLRVIAHQSVLQFKQSTRPAPEIAQMLDVKYLVDGSVRQDSTRVRITASLIDAARSTPVWSKDFERDRRDAMTLQREVALAIADAINVTLTAQDRSRLAPSHVPDPEAFDLYIRGTQARYEAASLKGDNRDAIRYLSAAVAMDSGYAAAYAGLALAYIGTNDTIRARAFAARALALDPKLAEAHMAHGMIRQFLDWDLAGADSAFHEALRLNPGFAEAHHELSMLLERLKKFDESLREGRQAIAHAPTSLRFVQGMGDVQMFRGQYDESLEIANRLLAMDSANGSAHMLRGFAYEGLERWDDAARAWAVYIRAVPAGGDFARARIGYIYGLTGRRTQAVQILDTLKARLPERDRSGAQADLAVDLATVYMGLGDRAQALTWLERATALRAGFMLYLAINPTFKSLHTEPRFQALLRKIGLPN